MGCAVTRMTELATDVIVSEVIQKEKCAARIRPMRIIRMMLFFGRDFSSCNRFLLSITKGKIMSEVKRSRYKEMVSGGACIERMKMDERQRNMVISYI